MLRSDAPIPAPTARALVRLALPRRLRAVFVAKPLQNQTVDINDDAPHSDLILDPLFFNSRFSAPRHIHVTWIPAIHAGMTDRVMRDS